MNQAIKVLMIMFVIVSVAVSGCSSVSDAPTAPIVPTLTAEPVRPTITAEPTLMVTQIPAPVAPPLAAIQQVRVALALPELPLSFVESTRMLNSPSGRLAVVVYQDGEGRQYLVAAETNQVVEIDARLLLPQAGDTRPPIFSQAELKSQALAYLQAVDPDFEELQSAWQYEENGKGEVYFFTWYGEMSAGSMNRPFAQLGIHESGLLFAYSNTLLLEP
jgi:hypothetical protein